VLAVVGMPWLDHRRLAEALVDLQLTASARLTVLVEITRAGRSLLPAIRSRGLRPLPAAISAAIGVRAAREAFQIGRPVLITTFGQLVTAARMLSTGGSLSPSICHPNCHRTRWHRAKPAGMTP
jgi:hypothetical protein